MAVWPIRAIVFEVRVYRFHIPVGKRRCILISVFGAQGVLTVCCLWTTGFYTRHGVR